MAKDIKLLGLIAPSLWFFEPKCHYKIPVVISWTGALKKCGFRKIYIVCRSTISRKQYKIRPWLRWYVNGSQRYPFDPCQFCWPWMTLTWVAQSFWYSYLPLYCLTNSNQNWHGNVGEWRVFRWWATPPSRGCGTSAAQFWGFSPTYAYILYYRTTKFSAMKNTCGERCVLGVSHAIA